jgi:uncharacterized membrane protein
MKYFFLLVAPLFMLACTNGTNTGFSASDSTNTDTTTTDTASYTLDSTNSNMGVNTRAPEGIFQALLPCPDCKGLQHTIAFYTNLTYRLEEEKLGKKGEIKKSNGNWKPSNGIIELYNDQLTTGRYKWVGDTLMYMQGTNTIPMRKLTTITDNEVWLNKKSQGVDFFGVGNEPFWNIEIDDEKAITFQLADWTQPLKLKPVKPIVSADSVLYNASNDSTTLRITIYNTFCSDGMSNNMYNNKVKVVYNKQTYSGCGMKFK